MVRFYLIRHGETTANVDKKIQGHSDLSLTSKGILEIKNVASMLKKKK
ncbi:phosphoglycerate mutase family protein [Streptococcus sp. H49]